MEKLLKIVVEFEYLNEKKKKVKDTSLLMHQLAEEILEEYNYSKEDVVKMIINNHLSIKNVPKAKILSINAYVNVPKEFFIKRAIEINGDKYDYSQLDDVVQIPYLGD